MRKKLLNEKIKELEEKCKRLETYIDFGIVMKHSDYNMQSPYYESNVAMEKTEDENGALRAENRTLRDTIETLKDVIKALTHQHEDKGEKKRNESVCN